MLEIELNLILFMLAGLTVLQLASEGVLALLLLEFELTDCSLSTSASSFLRDMTVRKA